MVDGSLTPFSGISAEVSSGAIVTVRSTVYTVEDGQLVLPSTTLTVDGSPITISGHTISLAQTGLIIDGSLTPFSVLGDNGNPMETIFSYLFGVGGSSARATASELNGAGETVTTTSDNSSNEVSKTEPAIASQTSQGGDSNIWPVWSSQLMWEALTVFGFPSLFS